MINTWINAFLKPKETFAAEKSNATLGKGLVNYLIGGLITGLISFIVLTLGGAALAGAAGAAVGGVVGVIAIFTTAIMTIVVSLIFVGIIFIVAKILGANGSYTQLYYLISLVAVPLAILTILSFVPVAGWILNLLVGLYSLYLWVVALQESQGLSTGRAVAAILIPIIVIGIIVAILAVLLGAAILGGLLTGLPGTTGQFGLV